MVPGGGEGCQVALVVGTTEDTALEGGHGVVGLHWGEGGGVVLHDVGKLVLPGDHVEGGEDKEDILWVAMGIMAEEAVLHGADGLGGSDLLVDQVGRGVDTVGRNAGIAYHGRCGLLQILIALE